MCEPKAKKNDAVAVLEFVDLNVLYDDDEIAVAPGVEAAKSDDDYTSSDDGTDDSDLDMDDDEDDSDEEMDGAEEFVESEDEDEEDPDGEYLG